MIERKYKISNAQPQILRDAARVVDDLILCQVEQEDDLLDGLELLEVHRLLHLALGPGVQFNRLFREALTPP